MWKEPLFDASLSGGAPSYHQKAIFPSIILHVIANVEMEKNIKRRQLWKQPPQTPVANQSLNLAYFACTRFASTYLVNLPPFDSNSVQWGADKEHLLHSVSFQRFHVV